MYSFTTKLLFRGSLCQSDQPRSGTIAGLFSLQAMHNCQSHLCDGTWRSLPKTPQRLKTERGDFRMSDHHVMEGMSADHWYASLRAQFCCSCGMLRRLVFIMAMFSNYCLQTLKYSSKCKVLLVDRCSRIHDQFVEYFDYLKL